MKILITGTDTGIGKTIVSSLLYLHLREASHSVRIIKPVETGCCIHPDFGDGPLGPDTALFMELSGKKQNKTETNFLSLSEPVAPNVAARAENVTLNYQELIDWVSESAEDTEILLIEGAGGLLVPITDEKTFADFAIDAGLTTMLVVGSKLGALNHAALSFELLKSRKLSCLGYVVNEIRARENADDKRALETNRDELLRIASHYQISELAELPFCPDFPNVEKLLEISRVIRWKLPEPLQVQF